MSSSSTNKLPKDQLYPNTYWSRPKIEERKKGDATDVEIFTAVGRALSSWEQSQDNLAGLILLMFKSTDAVTLKAASRLFGSVESIGGRVAAFKAVAEVYIGRHWPAVRTPITALLAEIQRASWRRNDIAHGQVTSSTTHFIDSDGEPAANFSGYMLTSPVSMTSRNALYPVAFDLEADSFALSTSDYRLNSADIYDFASKFDRLNIEIFNLGQQLAMSNKLGIPRIAIKHAYPGLTPEQIEAMQ